jgi:hypothetical protein
MAKISKSGIGPFRQINAEHITRIIDALNGESPDIDIEISGSIVLKPINELPESARIGTLITIMSGSKGVLNYYDGTSWIPLS